MLLPPWFDEGKTPSPDDDFAFDEEPDWNSPPDAREIADQRHCLLMRQREFSKAAKVVAWELATLEAVKRIVLFGSVANPLVEEVPRFRHFRRWGIAVPHECKDVDLAVWMDDFTNLRTVQKAKLRGLNALLQEEDIGVAHHQVDIFLFDATTGRYAGRLCQFAVCPKSKPECRREGCGQPPYMKSDPDFSLQPDALIPERSRELYVCG